MKTILAATLAAASLVLAAQGAQAHATFAEAEVTQNSTARLTLRVPHGCEGQATLKVRIQIPEGIIAVKPMPKAGWTLETVTGAYQNSYELYGAKVTEGVKEIIWTGNLPDAFYDEFVFRGRITDTLTADKTVFIPVVQDCANGAERWIEIPKEGQDAHDLESPAPGITVKKAGHSAH